jgi:hypothetical protein
MKKEVPYLDVLENSIGNLYLITPIRINIYLSKFVRDYTG